VLPHPHLEPLRMTSAIPEAPPNLKLLLIGNSSVGKSSLLTRFTDASFTPEDESSATIGVDFRVCKMEVKGKRVKLSIWVRACTLLRVWSPRSTNPSAGHGR
jgi:GTPase SAR1 family protein